MVYMIFFGRESLKKFIVYRGRDNRDCGEWNPVETICKTTCLTWDTSSLHLSLFSTLSHTRVVVELHCHTLITSCSCFNVQNTVTV